MIFQHIEIKEIDETIAILTLRRPEKRNALNMALMEEISNAFDEFQKDPKLRVAIIRSEGPVFCAGLDLLESTDPTLIEPMAQHVARLFKAVYTSPLVTISAIQGDAIAGGAGLVTACDYALIAKGARMGFPETRRGLIAAQVSTLLLRQLRMRDVRELLLLAELIDSEKAVKFGLANRVVEKSQLESETMKIANLILQGGPQAVKDTKRLLESLDPACFFDDLETALSFHHTVRHSEEAKEGIAAFLEKRTPCWTK